MRVVRRRMIQTMAAALSMGAAAIATAASPSNWALPKLSPERKEEWVATLEPWVEFLNEVFEQPFIGPFLSVCFFVMILRFAKRSK